MADRTKTLMISIILVIVAIIVIFSFIGGTSTNITDSANSITDANNCSRDKQVDAAGITFTYDQDTKQCQNSTGGDQYLAGQFDLPLNALFGSNGVALLIMMAAILLFVIILLLKKMRSK